MSFNPSQIIFKIYFYLPNELAFNCFTILIENNALRSTINEELTMQFPFIPKRHFAFSSKHTESTRESEFPLFSKIIFIGCFIRMLLLLPLFHKTFFFFPRLRRPYSLTKWIFSYEALFHFLFSMSEKREEEKASDEKAFT